LIDHVARSIGDFARYQITLIPVHFVTVFSRLSLRPQQIFFSGTAAHRLTFGLLRLRAL